MIAHFQLVFEVYFAHFQSTYGAKVRKCWNIQTKNITLSDLMIWWFVFGYFDTKLWSYSQKSFLFTSFSLGFLWLSVFRLLFPVFRCPLYNIVLPYLRHYSAFVPKVMPKVYSFRHFVSNKKSNTPILNTPSLL